MRIAVLGSGRQGFACAVDLLREEDVRQVLLLDSDPAALDAAARRIADPRLSTELVDAADEAGLSRVLSGCAAAVSAVPYFLNLGITRAAIRAGCSLTDMGGNTDVVFQQRSLDPEARRASVTVVPDLGLAPGLGNVLGAAAIRGMEEVDRLSIRCGGLPLDPEPPLGYALFFSIHGLLNEYSGEAACLREGRIARRPALSEPEWIDFPDPVGLCRAVLTSGGCSTLPWTLKGRVRHLDYKTVRYPGHWPRISFLRELGLLDPRPMRVGRTTLPAREIAAAALLPLLDRGATRDVVVLRVSARGRRDGERFRRRYDILETGDPEGGLSAMMKLTAFPTAAVALALARRQLDAPGVAAAEVLVDADRMIHHLRNRGIAVSITESARRD